MPYEYTLGIISNEIEMLEIQVKTLEMHPLEIANAEARIKDLNEKIDELQYILNEISNFD